MATGFSNVVVVGNFTADPELKQTQSGKMVCSFTLAINGRMQNDPPVFLRVTAWDKTAEFVSKYFAKGSSALVQGNLASNSWTDQNGQKRTEIYLNAQTVCFYGSREDNGRGGYNNGGYNNGYNAAPSQYGQTPQKQTPRFEEVKPDDDLPF